MILWGLHLSSLRAFINQESERYVVTPLLCLLISLMNIWEAVYHSLTLMSSKLIVRGTTNSSQLQKYPNTPAFEAKLQVNISN
jgi:hypothetical protein